jgi:hypothetical protein
MGAGVYKWGLRRGHSYRLGLHPIILQVEIYVTKACIIEKRATQAGIPYF